MIGEKKIKSETSTLITCENKVAIMLDFPGNRSKAFDIDEKEPTFQFSLSLRILIAINTTQWNCCLGYMQMFYS